MKLKVRALHGWYFAMELEHMNTGLLLNKSMRMFSMLVLKTASGAVYKIWEEYEDYWVIKKRKGNKYPISIDEMKYLKIRKGESFYYPNGNTSAVVNIYAINEDGVYSKIDDAKELIIPVF